MEIYYGRYWIKEYRDGSVEVGRKGNSQTCFYQGEDGAALAQAVENAYKDFGTSAAAGTLEMYYDC